MKNLLPVLLLVSATFCSREATAQTPPPSAPPSAPAPTAAPTPDAAPGGIASDAAAPGQPVSAAKAAEIRKLLEETDTLKMTHQALQQMMASFKGHFGDAPPGFWEKIEKEVDLNSLVAQVIPVYDRYYTLEDLKAVNAFYETPAGRHMVAASPEIMMASQQIAQDWGRDVAKKVQDELAKAKEDASQSAAPAAAPAATEAPATPPPAPASAPAPADDKK